MQSSLLERQDRCHLHTVLHHIIAIGDWSQISGMMAYEAGPMIERWTTLAQKIGELIMEFSAVRSVIEKASDPVIHVIRNCRLLIVFEALVINATT